MGKFGVYRVDWDSFRGKKFGRLTVLDMHRDRITALSMAGDPYRAALQAFLAGTEALAEVFLLRGKIAGLELSINVQSMDEREKYRKQAEAQLEALLKQMEEKV